MTEEEVLQIATVFMNGVDLKSYVYSLHNICRKNKNLEHWNVTVYLESRNGSIFSGPAFIAIDDITGAVLHYGQTRYVPADFPPPRPSQDD